MIARAVRVVAVVLSVVLFSYLPVPVRAAEPVIIPNACEVTHSYNAASSLDDLKSRFESIWSFKLTGKYWTDETYRPLIAVIWRGLDAISCTPYLETLQSKVGVLEISATSIGGWTAGDYGLTKANAISLDFPQLLTNFKTDPGHVSRLFVHEITHAYTRDRSENPSYWADFTSLYAKHGRFGSYGNSASEVFSEVVGYYVARCATMNPYTPQEADYYNFAKNEVFGGKEFGPALGKALDCTKTVADQSVATATDSPVSVRGAIEAAIADREAASEEIAMAGTALYAYQVITMYTDSI